MRRETKDLKLEVKEVSDDGRFTGYLSVYDIVDLGNDVVEKGAFTKTIAEQKGVVPFLMGHNPHDPMGLLHLTDDDYGLKVDGEFFLEASARVREMHGMAKRFHEKGRPMGLSIGFETIRKKIEKGVRHLKEIKLFEGSLTLFPMLPAAQITDIKEQFEVKGDFASELQRMQVFVTRGIMLNALHNSLDSIVYESDSGMDAAARVAASQESIDQFKAGYLEHLPTLLDAWGVKGRDLIQETKAGRRISSETRARIEDAISKLQALLQEEDTTSEESDAGKSLAASAATQDSAPEDSLHPLMDAFLANWEARLQQL